MIKAAIVGLGWWGRVLTDAVQDKSDSIRVVSGHTRTKAKAEAYAAEKGFRLLDSYDEVLADSEVDAVILATPHSAHRDQVIAAAAAGKHVFVEKPLALTLADAHAALAAVDAAGVAFGIGFNRRFSPAMRELERRVQSGALGTLLHFEATMTAPIGLTLSADAWRADAAETPAGGLTPLGIHLIDAIIALAGPITEAYCKSVHIAVDYGGDDMTSIVLQLESGATAYMGVSLATGVGFRMQAFGTGGWVEIRNPSLNRLEFVPNPTQSTNAKPMTGQHKTAEPEVIDYEPFDNVRAGLEAFAAAAQGGPPFPITRQQVLQGTAALEAIVESSRSGRLVRAPASVPATD